MAEITSPKGHGPNLKKRHSEQPDSENINEKTRRKNEKLSLSPGKNKRVTNNYSEFGTSSYYGNFNIRI